MRYDFGDFNFKEQAELMNMLNNYQNNNQILGRQSIGFNQDFLYNAIDKNQKEK